MLRDKACWHRFYSVGVLWYLLTFQYLRGCDNGGSSGPPPIGPDLRGRWGGAYYQTNRGGQLSLTATVRQDGDAVTITTSKTGGTAVLLTGTTDERGHLDMTDGFDGQEWTSFFGPASTNHIKLADYVETPSLEDPDPPLYVLDLTR